jgi:hypothetical protein
MVLAEYDRVGQKIADAGINYWLAVDAVQGESGET